MSIQCGEAPPPTGVDMLLLPDSQTVEQNAVGQLTLHVDPHGIPTTGIRALISYPSGMLQVVDADGNPATEIDPILTTLDAFFINEVTNGSIDYQAVAFLNDDATDPFDAATISFKCVAQGSASVEFLPHSAVTDPNSVDVTGQTIGARIDCGEALPGENQPPDAFADAPTTANEGDTVTLDGSSSFDPDTADTVTFSWVQTSGAPVNLTGADTAIASFVAPDNGTYGFMLTVSDGLLSDTANVVVTVLNVGPSVEAGPNQTAAPGATVSLAATFSDPGSLDTHVATINWDDGTIEGPFSVTGGTVPGSHAYTAVDVYTVAVTVQDDDGDSDSGTFTVNVKEEVPVEGNDWTGTLNITGSVTGNPIRVFGIRPGCSNIYEPKNAGLEDCDIAESLLGVADELKAYFHYPNNPPNAFADSTNLKTTRIAPPDPANATLMFPLRVQIDKQGAANAEVTIQWDLGAQTVIPDEFITVLLIDHTPVTTPQKPRPPFYIVNIGKTATGQYTFEVKLDGTGSATWDLTVVVTRSQVQALRLSTGPQIIALSVNSLPEFGGSIESIFKFTGPGRTSVSDEPNLFVLQGFVSTWFNDFTNPVDNRLRGTVDVGDPRHPVLIPGFGYVVTMIPLDNVFRDAMVIIPGEPVVEHTRTSP